MAKILIVDDDPDLVLAARTVLEAEGHVVEEAYSGDEGLSKVKSVDPDLIILDVMMESTTEGFRLAMVLRNPDPSSEYAEFAHIPILMLTAIHSTTPLRFAPDEDYLPVDDFIEKPFEPEDLAKRVNEKLAAKSVEE